MSITGANKAVVAFPQSDVEKLKDQTSANLEGEKARLKKATQEFESFFMYQMLKTMRKTVPESTFSEGAPFSGDAGKDIFTEMFDMELSRKMVSGGKQSISEMLYESMVKLVETQFDPVRPAAVIRPLGAEDSEGIKLEAREYDKIPEPEEKFEIKPDEPKLLPVVSRPSSMKQDSILSRYGEYIANAADTTSLDPALIVSVIRAESNGDASAVSPAGAKGLMQLMDSTASDYGVEEVFDPRQNIEAGSRYLKDLVDRFGSLKLALAAYNAGPGNVERYGGVPPFAETQKYVEKVIDTLNTLGHTAGSAIPKE